MAKFSKSTIPAVMAATVCATLAACSSSSSTTSGGEGTKTGGSLSIAGIFQNTSDPYWQTVICGAQTEAKSLGVKLAVYSSTNTDVGPMNTNFQAALLKNPDGVTVSPFTPTQFSSQIAALMRKGVPVVAGEQAMVPSTQLSYVEHNITGADYVKQFLALVPSTGSVAVLGGAPGYPALDLHWKPLLAVLKTQRPSIKILPVQYDNFDTNKAATISSSLMLAHPDLRMIIADTPPEGQAAGAAVAEAKKQGKVKVFAYGTTPAEIAALKSGSISALVALPAYNMGRTEVRLLVEYLRAHPGSKTVPANAVPSVNLPGKYIDKSNVDDPSNLPFLLTTTCR